MSGYFDQSARSIESRRQVQVMDECSGGRFQITYELLNLRALKFSPVDKIHIFQWMGRTFYVEFQRYPYIEIYPEKIHMK